MEAQKTTTSRSAPSKWQQAQCAVTEGCCGLQKILLACLPERQRRCVQLIPQCIAHGVSANKTRMPLAVQPQGGSDGGRRMAALHAWEGNEL